MRPYQQKILALMIKQELRVAELYQLLSEQVPELEDFLRAAHREEVEHAQWVEHLMRKVDAGELWFQEDPLRVSRIEAFLKHLDQTITKVRTEGCTALQALAMSAGAEEALIERRVFDDFDRDNPGVKTLLARLREQTKEHFTKIHRMRLRYLSGSGKV